MARLRLNDIAVPLNATKEEIRKTYSGHLDESKYGRFACENDLKYLCHNILKMEDWDIIHDEIQDFMDKIVWRPEERKKIGRQFRLILIPRGHLKSSVVTKGWVIQQILRNPNIRVLLANAIWDMSRRFISSIQSWLWNKSELPKMYGDFKPNQKNTAGWNRDEILINQRTAVHDAKTVSTTGVEAAQTSQHYDLIVLDDVVERENVRTKEGRRKVKEFYNDCLNLLEPDGIILVVGTTWGDDDLYNSLQNDDNYKGENGGIFKRVAEQGTPESIIFKKKFTWKTLMAIKGTAIDTIKNYSAQYLMNPYPEEDMEFRKNWIKTWKELPNEPMYVSITIDPSLGKDNSDYSAIVSRGMTFDGKSYILEARKFKRTVDKLPEEVAKTIRYLDSIGKHPNIIGLEAFGFQQTLKEPIQKYLDECGLSCVVELLPRKTTESKIERIRALIPKFASYSILLHESQNDLINQLMKFSPEKDSEDDLIDALGWQIYYWNRKPGQVINSGQAEGTFDWWAKRIYQPKGNPLHILREFR